MRLLLMQDLIFHNKKIDYKMSDDDGGGVLTVIY